MIVTDTELTCCPPSYLWQPFDRPAPGDPFDPYSRGPFSRGFDPYFDRDPLVAERSLQEDPYRDPYSRDLWPRDRPVTAEPETKPEERLFVPVESVDYGHGAAKPAGEESAVRGVCLSFVSLNQFVLFTLYVCLSLLQFI